MVCKKFQILIDTEKDVNNNRCNPSKKDSIDFFPVLKLIA